MKKTFRTLSMIAFLTTVTISCQKEEVTEPIHSPYQIQYTVNGTTEIVTLFNDNDLDSFFDSIIGLAREGYTIVINGNRHSSTKYTETITYTTTDSDDAKRWMADMTAKGYTVSITYNPDNGIFTCIAQR